MCVIVLCFVGGLCLCEYVHVHVHGRALMAARNITAAKQKLKLLKVRWGALL
jgi:hypothetical protein